MAQNIPEIVQSGHPVLHTPAKEVPVTDISSPEIQKVIKDMTLALESQDDGVGLAAPQIGVGLRIFMVAGFVFDRIERAAEMRKAAAQRAVQNSTSAAAKSETVIEDENEQIGTAPLTASATKSISTGVAKKKNKHQVFINPNIVKESKEKKWMDGEGCLSVRWLYGKVLRSTKVTLQAYDENGVQTMRGASGLLAHIFQHEVDHLNGILFTDKAKDLQEFDPEEIRKEAKLAKEKRNDA